MSSTIWRQDQVAWSQDEDVVGYAVEATDGSIGAIDEATTETDRACIVVDTGPWIFGKKRLIPAGLVHAVDRDSRTVRVALSKDQIKAAPDYEQWDEETRERHEAHYAHDAS